MSPERWHEIEELFQATVELPADERAEYPSTRCNGDDELRLEVENLLASDESAADFIEVPIWTDSRFLNSGKTSEAELVIAKWRKIAEADYVPPYFLAMSEVALGNKERAVELFDAARLEYSAWILWLATEPKLDSIRDHPPFIELVKKTGLPI